MKNLITFIAWLAFAASVFAGTSKYADISHEELLAAIAARTVAIIDVNGSESFNAGHIPGAIDFQASKDKLAAFLPKDKSTLVVAYCLSPECPAYALGANAAEKLGYTNVKHYRPGITGWLKSGAFVEKVN